jgi:hypothetical protein
MIEIHSEPSVVSKDGACIVMAVFLGNLKLYGVIARMYLDSVRTLRQGNLLHA